MVDINLTSDIKRVMIFLCIFSTTERKQESYNTGVLHWSPQNTDSNLHITDTRIHRTSLKIYFIYQLKCTIPLFINYMYVTLHYITILDMFRALICPSSGGQIVLSQHLVSSLSVQPFTQSDDTRWCDTTICPPEDGHVDARSMSRIVM
jgi:hypothetical protein